MIERWTMQLAAVGKKHPKLRYLMVFILVLFYAGLLMLDILCLLAKGVWYLCAGACGLTGEIFAHLWDAGGSLFAPLRFLYRKIKRELLPRAVNRWRVHVYAYHLRRDRMRVRRAARTHPDSLLPDIAINLWQATRAARYT